jgi:predicted RNase H-like HicB family nuclease
VFRVNVVYSIKEWTMAEYILSDYISKALSQALYEKLEDGTYAGKIPECTGVLAFGNSLRECEEDLQSTLEDWVLVGLKKGHRLPVIDGIDLNKDIIREPLETL